MLETIVTQVILQVVVPEVRRMLSRPDTDPAREAHARRIALDAAIEVARRWRNARRNQ